MAQRVKSLTLTRIFAAVLIVLALQQAWLLVVGRGTAALCLLRWEYHHRDPTHTITAIPINSTNDCITITSAGSSHPGGKLSASGSTTNELRVLKLNSSTRPDRVGKRPSRCNREASSVAMHRKTTNTGVTTGTTASAAIAA
ncbi:hypothetical protein [Chloroflexus sp.]|uniref:hypothetical protein n=1 Tax=Chloroflexus sp. TaxID=1904827 RepID=UPI003C782F00